MVLGDGAKWIWNVASELFPDAVEIVDVWHAREHLWEVARSVYGAGTALCGAWAGKACAALSEGRLDDVLAALRKHDGNDEARRCAGYVEANRARMRYPAFRAAGLPVGSGEVESSCGTVAGRLRRGGMRWSVDGGANPILTLRCWWLDGRYDTSSRRARDRRRWPLPPEPPCANKYVVHPYGFVFYANVAYCARVIQGVERWR